MTGAAGALLGGWNLSGIWTMRSGNPLTVFVTTNRSRSQWNPSRGPGIGQDRPDYAPGYGPDNAVLGRPEQWFDPAAFALQPAGTFGNTGRGDFTGPNLRTLDIALSKSVPLGPPRRPRRSSGSRPSTCSNRTNFGVPELRAFSGTDGQPVLATFGRITNTVTSSRQIQLGVGRCSSRQLPTSDCADSQGMPLEQSGEDSRSASLRRVSHPSVRAALLGELEVGRWELTFDRSIRMTWLVFVAGAVLSWGVYGAMLHQGQVKLGSPMRALLCVGVAYFLVGVVVPVITLFAQGQGLRGFNRRRHHRGDRRRHARRARRGVHHLLVPHRRHTRPT